jgi:hypothetical protein
LQNEGHEKRVLFLCSYTHTSFVLPIVKKECATP